MDNPYANIEPFVITSSKKLDDHWLWTRNSYDAAWGLTTWLRNRFDEAGDKHVTISLLDVADGSVTRR